MPHADELIAGGSRCSAVSFDERMDPVQAPERESGEKSWVVNDRPVLMNHGKEPVHEVRNFTKMRRKVMTDVDRIFPVTAAKLGDIGDCCMVQRPQRVLVKCLDSLFQADLNAIRQQPVLPQEILFLHSREQRWIVLFAN